jgi:hypothetical protein
MRKQLGFIARVAGKERHLDVFACGNAPDRVDS